MRCTWLLVVLVACASGPKMNEIVATHGRKTLWRGPVTSAVFCTSCGGHGIVQVEIGKAPKVVHIEIPSCYPHAHSRMGDHDKISIALVEGNVSAGDGQLDIEDCTTHHLTATLWATWPDETKATAKIDTELVKK